MQRISITGEVDAYGGDAFTQGSGGGSGGGIYIHAANVFLSGLLDVHGGLGGASPTGISGNTAFGGGGGGGGGAVLVQTANGYSNTGTVLRNGGLGGSGAIGYGPNGLAAFGSNGAIGEFIAPVPEPSSLVLLGTSTLGLLGAARVRGRAARTLRA